ncbi:MAG TPA: AAA family ATPase [Kofleriaceae bacterium]|jgi:DNA polymerase III delta prime subunit
MREAELSLVRDLISQLNDILGRNDTPFHDQQEMLAAQLEVTRTRLRVVRDYEQARLPGAGPLVWPAELAAVETMIDARSARMGVSLPLRLLIDRFELSDTEARLLWVLLAHDLCPIARVLLRELNTEHLSDPSTDALRRAVYGSAVAAPAIWRELGENATLRRLGLVLRTDDAPDAPFYRQTWKVSNRVLALAHGDLSVDPKLAKISEVLGPPTPADELEVVGDALAQLREACTRDGFVVVHGNVGSGRRSTIAAVLAATDKPILQIDGRSISKEPEIAEAEIRVVARECTLLGLTPFVRDLDALAGAGNLDRIAVLEAVLPGLIVATSNRPIPRHWKRPTSTIELRPLSGAQRTKLWQRAVPTATSDEAAGLATMYPLAPALIRVAGRLALGQAGSQRVNADHIGAGLRSILDDRLGGLATRTMVTQSWSDIVLPEEQMTAIAELMARIRERQTVYEQWRFGEKVGKALGVSALFSGPPGTGKTMAAGLIARDLKVEIYQVDISKIVSKWIGETEKNLASLFDAAEAGHAIVLFDEADALFSKRTEVKSSNDRYANQEVNYLLQRMESFAGIVILTTNHETAIDEAFRRRLSIHVRFPLPESDERLRLWEALIPAAAPTTGDLGLQKLADHFQMSGGYIRNAVLRAAFLAASERKSIGASHLAQAAHLEYEALGKIASKV